MHKIPVGETISGAYGFAFAGFLTVLGTVWFPFLVLVALEGGAVYLVAPDLPSRVLHGDIDMTLILNVHRVRGIFWIVNLIIGSMMTVGLQQRALGLVQGPTFIFFSFGGAVWRMVAASFLAFVALIIIGVVTTVAAVALCTAATVYVAHYGVALAILIGVAACFWVLYVCVRLLFFLPAVVTAENEIGLVRAWELGGGNFWRIVAVCFVVFVPVIIGFYIVAGALLGPFIPWDMFAHIRPNMTPQDMEQFDADFIKRMFQGLRSALPVVFLLVVIQQVIFAGLGNGAIAKAYLGVTGKE